MIFMTLDLGISQTITSIKILSLKLLSNREKYTLICKFILKRIFAQTKKKSSN